jgi:hypothetical protein
VLLCFEAASKRQGGSEVSDTPTCSSPCNPRVWTAVARSGEAQQNTVIDEDYSACIILGEGWSLCEAGEV